MILVDTSIWVDHLHQQNEELIRLLDNDTVLIHPFIIGELACGSLHNRRRVLAGLHEVPLIETISNSAVMDFIERNMLFNTGIGWIDAHLLTATAQTKACRLWTRDKRLQFQAARLNLAKTAST
ncbi:MAG: type II toxin-antitoxin system VapC family toxin [Gammaproteobacteria bacterium]|nr:type II toxin-antitoxin system VapC family toxin [Gammaproteobacteria bacterium]NNJ83825.1 type II toxin-antitoxin system VapC family toxin [Gammaproteobacteria bacterium]